MSSCLKDLKTDDLYLRKNQSLKVVGEYNYDDHPGNWENGHIGEVSDA
jgi:hypothetical protein